MKIRAKVFSLAAVLSGLMISSNAYAGNPLNFAEQFVGYYQYNIQAIDKGLDRFSDQLAISVPQAATQQNVYPDAYIGNLFPGVPCHFGVGVNVGVTHLDTTGLARAARVLDIANIKNDYCFPTITADARIGGIFLPFDIGFTFMRVDPTDTSIDGCDITIDLLTIGADVRYAILDGEGLLPNLSVGVGYYYNEGGFKANSSYTEAGISYKVHTTYGQVQLSKQFVFVTPFIGIRGLVSKHSNEWDWKISNPYVSYVVNLASAATGNYYRTSDKGSSSSGFDFNAIQPQIYAGVGLNFFMLQFTVSVCADLKHVRDDKLWSGATSLRIKI